MALTLNPLGPVAAAEIVGLDCSRPLSEDIVSEVRRAYLTYPVLVFRNQQLSAPQLAAFGRYFGKLESYGAPSQGPGDKALNKTAALRQTNERETPDQMFYLSPEDPDVLIMTNEVHENFHPIGIVDNAETWHSDGSHKPEPYQAVIVHVLQNPSSGGDTEFCDMRAVYNALPQEIQERLMHRMALHHWSKALNRLFAGTLDEAVQKEGERIAAMMPAMSQPVVRTHPETGRLGLYVSPRFTLRIEGVSQEASDVFLDRLFAFADDPIFHYRHEWREGDLMIWDNRCLNHRVRAYPAKDIRRRYRVTVAGDKPF